MRRSIQVAGLILALLVAGVVSSARAQQETQGAGAIYVGPNIRITLTVGDVNKGAGASKRTYRLIAQTAGNRRRC